MYDNAIEDEVVGRVNTWKPIDNSFVPRKQVSIENPSTTHCHANRASTELHIVFKLFPKILKILQQKNKIIHLTDQ